MACVTLGYVDNWSRPLRHPRGQPWDSRAGGLPAFFADRYERPVCATCSRPMFLVLQLYAPTEVERTLLVFGCNSAACNKSEPNEPARLGSWKVIRTQGGPVQAEEPAAAAAAAEEASSATPAATANDWGDAGWGDEDDNSFGAGSSAADPVEGANAVGSAADALAVQLAGLAVAAAPAAAAAVSPADPAPPAPYAAPYTAAPEDLFSFPAYTVETCDEPYPDDDEDPEFLEDEEGEAEGEGSDGVKRTGGGRGDATSRKLDGIWKAYQAWEAETAKAPVGGEGGPDGADAGSDSSEGEGGAPGGGKGGRRKGGDEDGEAAAAGAGGEKYEALPRRVRYSLGFQARVGRLPSQVVRYAYGASPLLPVPPEDLIRAMTGKPSGSSGGSAAHSKPAHARDIPVPKCPGCGARRLFEAQLMPSLLFGLRVDEHTAEDKVAAGEGGGKPPAAAAATPAPSPDAPLSALFGGGMDFATVLVYSCEASCAASHEEVAIAIPTP